MKKRENYYGKLNIKIGKLLQGTRRSLGLTQEQVAEKLDLAPRYISDIERDKTKGTIDTLVKLCNIYKVTPTYILQDYLDEVDVPSDESIVGFYKLSERDKEIIRQVIAIMNKKLIKQYNFTKKPKLRESGILPALSSWIKVAECTRCFSCLPSTLSRK